MTHWIFIQFIQVHLLNKWHSLYGIPLDMSCFALPVIVLSVYYQMFIALQVTVHT